MSHFTRVNRASSFFFFTGFVFSKLQRLPIVLLSTVLNVVSLALYLIGYFLWFIATLINPDKSRSITTWYGFAEFKEQARCSALIGIIATLLSLVAILFPMFLLPAAWLFLVSNIIWTISEYHLLNNPPLNDPNFSHSHQETYLSYAITLSISSLLSALSITIGLLFPAVAMPVLIVTLILSVGLGALALGFWLSCSFGDHKPSKITPSYERMSQGLGSGIGQLKTNSLAPYQATILFNKNDAPQKEELNSATIPIANEFSDPWSIKTEN